MPCTRDLIPMITRYSRANFPYWIYFYTVHRALLHSFMYVLRTRAFLIHRQLREQYRLLIKRLPRAIKSLLLCAPSRIDIYKCIYKHTRMQYFLGNLLWNPLASVDHHRRQSDYLAWPEAMPAYCSCRQFLFLSLCWPSVLALTGSASWWFASRFR